MISSFHCNEKQAFNIAFIKSIKKNLIFKEIANV
jgi:hypothetical protein